MLSLTPGSAIGSLRPSNIVYMGMLPLWAILGRRRGAVWACQAASTEPVLQLCAVSACIVPSCRLENKRYYHLIDAQRPCAV